MIDKVNLAAQLAAPGRLIKIDRNPQKPVATFHGKIEMTCKMLEGLTRGGINLHKIYFEASYKADGNVIRTTTRGHLPDTNTEEKMKELAKAGWVFDAEVCESYGLKCPTAE